MIMISTIPTAVIGLLFNDLFESLYSSMLFIGAALPDYRNVSLVCGA